MPQFEQLGRVIRNLFFVLSGLLPATALQGQSVLAGIVTDSSGAPLPFVSILINHQPGRGVLTDIEGRFYIENPAGDIQNLEFRYVGYKTLEIKVQGRAPATAEWPAKGRKIVLSAALLDLPEATVVAGENPADRLIRLAVENRRANNPENLSAYTCRTYNKIVLSALPDARAFDAWLNKDHKDSVELKAASDFERIQKSTAEHHLFLLESVTARSFLFPDQVSERVLLNRVSGFQQAGLVALANMLQPFSFYNDYLPLLGKDFVNPVSPGSTGKYFFNIEDTLYDATDTIWIISFKPRSGKVFESLKGVLYLHSDGYAIQNVRAEAARPNEQVQLKIEQGYTRISQTAGKRQWFPEQLNFELVFPKYPIEYAGLKASGRSYVSRVELNPRLRLRDFNREMPLLMNENAANLPDSMWQPYRNRAPLNTLELNTYTLLDSIGKANKFDKLTRILDALSTGYWPIKNRISLNLKQLLVFNTFEGVRLGVGLTNAQSRPLRPLRRLETAGYVAYGFKDKAAKAGFSLRWRVWPAINLQLLVSVRSDLTEPGALYELLPSALVNRFAYARRLDYTDELVTSLRLRPLKGMDLFFTSRGQRIRPGYNYAFRQAPDRLVDTFLFSETTISFRYVRGEKTQTFLGNTAIQQSDWPVVEAAYTRGRWESADYYRWVVALYQNIPIRGLGRASWRLEAGLASVGAPLAKLFTLNQNGSQGGVQLFVLPYTFQGLPDTLFAADRFVALYWAQTLGPVLYETRRSSPYLTLRQHLAWGRLQHPDLHTLGLRAPNPVLLESGIQVDDLLRLNFSNIAYLGLGGALFYRYGGLAGPDWKDGFIGRITLRLTL